MTISNEDNQQWEAKPVQKEIQEKLGKAGLEALANCTILETCDQTAMRTAENQGFSNGCAAWEDAVDELKEDV